ncbi:four helix bundle protein [Prosthecobacter vanneervenii]|uniref:Four helix bundle protein n=1 Tax=Prosthecobacter vanneervenii TaxID=48466 RepID=A0A7W7YEM3_9BACT|nr:four helix bundle protein [Prosthecobacter vanneervenii]MBB5034617.1 four helix bundle protein [Prosthecobacter vanneervenii]
MTDLPDRTKKFASRIINMYLALPKHDLTKVFGPQILRSATSVAAQTREGKRPKSPKDFISKIEGAIQELEETTLWLELIQDHKLLKPARLKDLFQEASELNAIMTTVVVQAKRKL